MEQQLQTAMYVDDVSVVASNNSTNPHSEARDFLDSVDICESDGEVDSIITRSDDTDRNESLAMTDPDFTFSDDED